MLLIKSPSTALRYLCLYSFFSPIEIHCEADFWMPKEYGVLSINGKGLAAGGLPHAPHGHFQLAPVLVDPPLATAEPVANSLRIVTIL